MTSSHPEPSVALFSELAPNLWTLKQSLRLFGVDLGTRMTVARLDDGALWVHSPVSLEVVRDALSGLGEVNHVIAPNRFHHLSIGDYESLPTAKLFIAPGLAKKRPELRVDAELDSSCPAAWDEAFEAELFGGAPMLSETVFFHRSSRTLIACDLVFNICAESAPSARFAFRCLGAYNRLGPTLVERLLIRDRKAARRSLEKILDWPFERVLMAHGEVAAGTEVRERIRDAYRWL